MFGKAALVNAGVKSTLVSALFFGGKFVNKTSREKEISDAVKDLNCARNVESAVRLLEGLSNEERKENVRKLNSRALCLLGTNGSVLCKYAHHSTISEGSTIRPELMDMLEKISVDAEWNKALVWYSINACGEDDPACNDITLWNRPSNIKKLIRLLHVLLNKTELRYSSCIVDQGALDVLYDLFQHFYTSNVAVCVYILKILANIAMEDAYCADAVAHSRWMSALLFLLDQNNETFQIISRKIMLNILYSLGVKRTHLGPGLYEFYSTPYCGNPEIDIVLLHGMRGSAFRTWRQKDDPKSTTLMCWPKAWLPGDIKGHFRILAVDYSSSLYGGHLLDNLHTRASRIYDLLTGAGVGDRPVVFICHSMGGLLAKQILIDSPILRCNTVGVLFMATPHFGTPVATNYSIKVLRPSDDLKLLVEGSEINKRLHSDFLETEPRVPLMVNVSETKKSPLFGFGTVQDMLVPNASSSFRGCGLFHIPEMHHNVVKPDSTDALSYRIILKFVEDALYHCRKEPNAHSCSAS